MFRPDRIGDHPLVAIDTTIFDFGTIGAFTSVEGQYEPLLSDTTVRSQTASLQFKGDTGSITTDRVTAIAVAVNGENPVGDIPDNPGFLLNVSGCVSARILTGTPGRPQLTACLGRANSDTLILFSAGNNPSAAYQNIPGDVMATDEYVQLSFNKTLVVGPYNAAVTYNPDPLMLGFNLTGRGGTGTYRIEGSLSVYKYTTDILTFDPTRT